MRCMIVLLHALHISCRVQLRSPVTPGELGTAIDVFCAPAYTQEVNVAEQVTAVISDFVIAVLTFHLNKQGETQLGVR